MPKYRISNKYIAQCNETSLPVFPKYTTQIINLANQNAGGTRPRIVGTLSELIPEYFQSTNNPTLEGWKEWYLERNPDAIDTAAEKIWEQVENLKNSIYKIDKDLVRSWVEDLVFNKTFNGFYYQKAILMKIAEIQGTKDWRLAEPYEESLNIDGYVNGIPYQIKPDSYDHMKFEVHEEIPCVVVKYRKTKTGIEFEF